MIRAVATVATVVTVITVLTVACAPDAPRDEPPPVASPALADSLVLEAPGGITVWFTQSRDSKDSAGAACVERALEVRRDSTRRGVGLLYTREVPTLLDKDHMRAVLYNNCQAGPAYRVDFATLSPRRITP